MGRLIPADTNSPAQTRTITLNHSSSGSTNTNALAPTAGRALYIYDITLSQWSATSTSRYSIRISDRAQANPSLTLFDGFLGVETLHFNYQNRPYKLEKGRPLGYFVAASAGTGGASDAIIRLLVRYDEVVGSS